MTWRLTNSTPDTLRLTGSRSTGGPPARVRPGARVSWESSSGSARYTGTNGNAQLAWGTASLSVIASGEYIASRDPADSTGAVWDLRLTVPLILDRLRVMPLASNASTQSTAQTVHVNSSGMRRFTYRAGRAEVEGFYIPGMQPDTALIFGGLHGNERAAKWIGNQTAAQVTAPRATQPRFTTVIVPDIFGNRQHTRHVRDSCHPLHPDTGNQNTLDPNRLMPRVGRSVNQSHGRSQTGHVIPPAILQVLRIREQLKPERILQLHCVTHHDPGIYSDARPGHETEDENLALEMARTVQGSAPVTGNHLGLNEETAIYPPEAVPGGTSFGMYGSRATPEAPAANVVLIEALNDQQPEDITDASARQARIRELMAYVRATLEIFLQHP